MGSIPTPFFFSVEFTKEKALSLPGKKREQAIDQEEHALSFKNFVEMYDVGMAQSLHHVDFSGNAAERTVVQLSGESGESEEREETKRSGVRER